MPEKIAQPETGGTDEKNKNEQNDFPLIGFKPDAKIGEHVKLRLKIKM